MFALKNLLKKMSSYIKADKGYSLIQMAIALMVIGLIITMFGKLYETYSNTQKEIKTQENLSTAIGAIHTYRQAFGHYPCPAPMNADRSLMAGAPLPAYGRSSDYARYLSTGSHPLTPGQCMEGICVEATNRGALGDVRVRVGSIPFRDLQLDENLTIDGYGSRMWYAVTENQCNLATFNDTIGGIRIINDRNEEQTSPPGSASYIVISPGPNRVGAYSKFGRQQLPCPATTVPEAENCRDVGVLLQVDTAATYRSQFTMDATAATSFDDVAEFFSASVNQLWRRTSPTSEDIVDVANANIGIGEGAPSATLDITQTSVNTATGGMEATNTTGANVQSGGLRVNTNTVANNGEPGSNLYAQTYCSETGTHCFQVKDIMGDATGTDGMKCPANQYPIGIESSGGHARFVCVADISIKCPTGFVFEGFDTVSGTLRPRCTNSHNFASCPATTKTLCSGNDVSLGVGSHNSTSAEFSRGSCRKVRYLCTNGNWNIHPSYNTGNCNNVVTSTSAPISCGTCWTGSYTQTTYSCSPATNNRSTQCKCQASSSCFTDIYGSCPANEPTGSGGQTRYMKVCDAGNPYAAAFVPNGAIGSEVVAKSCSCTKQSRNLFSACSTPGYIRTSEPGLPPAGDTSTNSWPSNTALGVAQHVKVVNCEYVNDGAPINACGCNTADRYTQQIVTTPSCKKVRPGGRTFGGTLFSWNHNVMKSVIEDAATCKFSNPVLHDAAQFDDLTPYWRELPGGATDQNRPETAASYIVDDPCTCDTLSNERKCRRGNSSGSWDIYNCRCGP